jgi:hypothetical protein
MDEDSIHVGAVSDTAELRPKGQKEDAELHPNRRITAASSAVEESNNLSSVLPTAELRLKVQKKDVGPSNNVTSELANAELFPMSRKKDAGPSSFGKVKDVTSMFYEEVPMDINFFKVTEFGGPL